MSDLAFSAAAQQGLDTEEESTELYNPDAMIALANKIGHPVIANTCVVAGTTGEGDWVEFYPTN